MSESAKRNLFSILAGIGTGLFMSIAVLYMMIISFFDIASISYWITAAACCAIPFCLTFLRQKGWNVFLAQIMMILTSFIITAIYGGYVTYSGSAASSYPSFWLQVLSASSLAHGLSLVCVCISEAVHHHLNK